MTITIYEFSDINEASGDPLYPAHRRRTALALSNTYHPICNTAATRAVLVYNDSSTTGVHVRIGRLSGGEDAAQGDIYIGPDATGVLLVARKDRSVSENVLYLNAVADT